MFTSNTVDLEYMFELMGQTVLVNDVERKAIITNPAISEYEERYIQTLDKVLQGDLVTLDNDKYLTITESITKRYLKYKALIRHCNYIIQIAGETEEVPMTDENGDYVYDDFGEAIYITVEGEPYYIPSIIDNKSFAVDSSSAVRVPDNQIIVVVQENELNQTKLAVNIDFGAMDRNWKVLNLDKTKKGLLVLTCELV